MTTRKVYPQTQLDTRNPDAMRTVSINEGRPVVVSSQEQLDAILKAAAEGRPLSFKSAPGRKR